MAPLVNARFAISAIAASAIFGLCVRPTLLPTFHTLDAPKGKCYEMQMAMINHSFIDCLYRNDPSLSMIYPCDAENHFADIHKALGPWLQGSEGHKMHNYAGYEGPWIENIWIEHFYNRWKLSGSLTDNGSLFRMFGPFIPLFIPWVDINISNPEGFVLLSQTVSELIREDVPYVTLSQNDVGLQAVYKHPNVLVLSAGGFGHVPVPLLLKMQPHRNHIPPESRSYIFNYVGSMDHAPEKLRRRMDQRMLIKSENFSSVEQRQELYTRHYGPAWASIMIDSIFTLAPRGFGRTSFHLMESLQMGFIPVQVYKDIPWIPYKTLLESGPEPVVYSTNLTSFLDLIERLIRMTMDEVRRKENRILELRESHFEPSGIMAQIQKLLTGFETDLECIQLPSTVRGV